MATVVKADGVNLVMTGCLIAGGDIGLDVGDSERVDLIGTSIVGSRTAVRATRVVRLHASGVIHIEGPCIKPRPLADANWGANYAYV